MINRNIIAGLLVFVMIFANAFQLVKNANAQTVTGNPLYEYDLKSFVEGQPDSKVAYDYLKLATALQGIVNRDAPHIYYYGEINAAARNAGMDMDRFWMDKLTEQGEYLAGYDIVSAADLFSLIGLFADRVDGIVLWDENVPATANVASTIAGVENLLPVRYDPEEGSVYDEVVAKRALFPVKVNLVGKFTGRGNIPDTTLQSTGSAKDDAYLWAKTLYLDTGLTNAKLMTYAIDGMSWVNGQGGELNARIVSAYIPDQLAAGQQSEAIVTVENTGSKTWTKDTNDRLASKADNQFVWSDLNGGFSNGATDQRVFLGSGEQIKSGERKTFRFKITAPATPGSYVFDAGMVRDGIAWMGASIVRTIKVTSEAVPDMPRGGELNAGMYSAYIPAKMQTGQEIDVAVTVENTGEASWVKAMNDRFASTVDNQFEWRVDSGFSNGPADQRVFLGDDEEVKAGERRTFHFKLKAPATAGQYAFGATMVRDGVAWVGETLKRVVTVTNEAQPSEDPSEVFLHAGPGSGGSAVEEPVAHNTFIYPDLYNSQLPNADYYIANRAFFFDLSPDENSVPVDDKDQPVGSDYDTLIELLRSQNRQAAGQFITIGGFVPWFLKYTNYNDPSAALDPVGSEWTFVDIASKYNAQLDADACCYIGLSNASIYRKVPLDADLRQANDKGDNGKAYEPDRKYVSFYMGDYDSAAWTSGVLPLFWDDPKRGTLPLAWPIAPALSERTPQVFNYLYETMSANDYIVAGDNGAGYLNPMMLQADQRPDGLPDFLSAWEQYNREYYDRFDLDITGFLISGNSWTVPLPVQEVYSRLSPAGVGTNGGYEANVVNGTPYSLVQSFGVEMKDSAQMGEQLASLLKGGQQFYNLRLVLTKPTVVADAVQYVKDHYPELKFDVVDPYTYYRLYKEGSGWNVEAPATYSAAKAATAVRVDGAIGSGEWDDAQDIEISAQSDDVKKLGEVWSNADGLDAKYRIKWDDDYLYLLEQRQGDALQFTETGGKMYLSDSTMLFLDLDHNKNGSTFRDGDYAVMMTASGPDGKPHLYMREGHNTGLKEFSFDKGEAASVVSGNSYVMEVAIPWSEMQAFPFEPAKDKRIGMTLLATHGPDKWGQIMWVGNGDDQANWADLELADDTRPPVDGGQTSTVTAPNPNKTEATIAAGGAGTARLGDEIELMLPAGASTEALRVTIEKLTGDAGLPGTNDQLLSPVFELLKNTKGKFDKPVTIRLAFDPAKLTEGRKPVVAYYDELAGKWVPVGGTVDGSVIAADTDHFTKYAVLGIAGADDGQGPAEAAAFNDIAGHWAADPIAKAAGLGIVKGYADGSFKPGTPVTRAEFAVMLVRAFKPEAEADRGTVFKDADRIGEWSREALGVAVQAGIMKGYEDGTLRPNAVITREEALAMAMRAAGTSAASRTRTSFADDADIAVWAKGYVAAASEQGLIQGTGGNRFGPSVRTSRAEAVVMVMNMLNASPLS